MRRLDRLHLEFPFAGSRICAAAGGRGVQDRTRHVKTLMQRMGIEALYRRPRTTKPSLATRSIRICCAAWRSRGEPGVGDGHHLHPMARGFVYLAVVLDWFSRRVLSWRLSITMEAAFALKR